MAGWAHTTDRAARICAGLLLAAFLSPLLALWTSLGPADDVTLPACCRMHGKHRCLLGRTTEPGKQDQPVAAQLSERCLYQASAPAVHLPNGTGSPTAQFACSAPAASPLLLQQRVFAASRPTGHAPPKRGPPATSVFSHEA